MLQEERHFDSSLIEVLPRSTAQVAKMVCQPVIEMQDTKHLHEKFSLAQEKADMTSLPEEEN